MPITLSAPAKLNLYLAVGSLRPDGYHDVSTVLCALDLGDIVTVSPAAELTLVCEPDVGVPAESNLAWKAAMAMAQAFGRPADFSINVYKRVPAGAGLGGGSADAAAVIAAICAYWQVDAETDGRPAAVAASLGADVVFPLRAGCALYTDRGDVPASTLRAPDVWFAIACGAEPVPTAHAYATLDGSSRGTAPGPSAMEAALESGDAAAVGAALYNDMTPAALTLVPEIAEQLAFMADYDGCLGAALCGSGAAVFGLFADRESAEAAAGGAVACGLWSAVARPSARGTLDQTTGANL